MDYDQIYQRNIGLFTKEEQEKLQAAKVAVAGVGGVGGIQAATLARFGVGHISILDPGIFDEPDMNRQYGAMLSTLGENKAVAMGKILKDINPFLKVEVHKTVLNQAQLYEFIKGSSLVIDAIDYAFFDYKSRFANIARKEGIINLSAPIPDFSTLLMIFDPEGMSFDEFFSIPTEEEKQINFKPPIERFFGKGTIPKNLSDFINGETPYISTNGGAATLSGSVLSTEAALIMTGKRKKEDIIFAPNILSVDLLSRTFNVFNSFEV